MNILQYLKNVNIDELENAEITNLQIHLTQMLAYQNYPDATKFHKEVVEDKYWYWALNIYDEKHAQKNCRQNVSTQFADSPEPKEEKERRKTDLSKKYSILFNCSKQGKEPFNFYKGIIKEFIATLRYMSIQKDGKTIFFPQNQTGNENYQIKKKWEMIDTCKAFDKKYKHCYFITLTLDPKKWGLPFLERWKPYAEVRNKFFKDLVSKFGGAYVWVNEAQLSGNPHTHGLFYTDYDFGEHHFHKGKKKKAQWIDGGKFFEEVNKLWGYGFTQLDINRRKNTYNYLVKYIAKAVTHDLKKSLKSNKREEEACKNILSIVCPIATRTRSWGHSEIEIEKTVCQEENKTAEFSTPSAQTSTPLLDETLYLTESNSLELLSYLKTLSNKSLPSCVKPIAFYSQRRLDDLFSNNGERANDFSEERKAKVHLEHAKAQCKGCVIIHLMNYFIADNKDFYLFRNNLQSFANYFYQANEDWFKLHGTPLKKLSNSQKFIVYMQYFNKDFNNKYTLEQIKEFFRVVFMGHWSIWYILLPSEVASYFINVKNRNWGNANKLRCNQKFVDVLTDIFEDNLLTPCDNGVIL